LFSELAGILAHYIKEIADGAIPCIQSAVEATADALNQVVLKDCMLHYKKLMSAGQQSDDESLLRTRHEQSATFVKAMFGQQIMILDDPQKFSKLLSVSSYETYTPFFLLQYSRSPTHACVQSRLLA